MSTHSMSIDRLRIATPCPVSWEQMSGDNRVRFCDQCQLKVYNITALSRAEAQSLIASSEGRLCARIYRRADGTILTSDCPVGLRALRMRISKRAAAVFAVLAGLAGTGFGQQSTLKDGKTACLPQVRITRRDGTAAKIEDSLSGTVADQSGGAVPGAIVTITSEAAKEVRTTTTNDAGKFEFASLPPGEYSLKVEALGFLTIQLSSVLVEASKVINVETVVTISHGWSSGITSLPFTPVRPSHPGTTIIDGDLIRRLPIQ